MIRKISIWTCAALFVVGAGIWSAKSASAGWGRDAGFWNKGYQSRHYGDSCTPNPRFRGNDLRGGVRFGSGHRGDFRFDRNRYDFGLPSFGRYDRRGHNTFDRFDWTRRGYNEHH